MDIIKCDALTTFNYETCRYITYGHYKITVIISHRAMAETFHGTESLLS